MSALARIVDGLRALLGGLKVTFANLAFRPKVTLQYPYEEPKVSPRYRGLFYLPYDADAGRLRCVGCTLCAQACPTKVISMKKLGGGKNAGVSEFTMDLGRCMFCNLCIEACPFDAIHMGGEYRLTGESRSISLFRIADLAEGGSDSVASNNRTIEAAITEEARVAAERSAHAPSKLTLAAREDKPE